MKSKSASLKKRAATSGTTVSPRLNPLDLDAVKASGESSDQRSQELLDAHRARTEAEFQADLRRGRD